MPASGQAASSCPTTARALERLVAAGRPVICHGGRISGDIHLPTVVRAPFVLRGTKLDALFAQATTFSGPVDLSAEILPPATPSPANGRSATGTPEPPIPVRTTVEGAADFSFAVFERLAAFSGTSFQGRVSFVDADFHGVAHFQGAQFAGPLLFSHASFGERADLSFVEAFASVAFAAADFKGVADFEGATFDGTFQLDGASFNREARFARATFAGASFAKVRFDGGADFSGADFEGPAVFDQSAAAGVVRFDSATFSAAVGLSTVHLATADFTGAVFGAEQPRGAKPCQTATVNLDQAIIGSLDLSRVAFGRSSFLFPQLAPASGAAEGLPPALGRIDALRIAPGEVGRLCFSLVDPAQVARMSARDRDELHSTMRAQNEAAYALVETAARRADDLTTANQANVLRLGLIRDSRPAVARQLDWVFLWGIGGYLVRPLHPALAIVTLLLIGIATRLIAGRRTRRTPSAWAAGLRKDVGSALSALWQVRLGKASTLRWIEAAAYKLLLVLFLANLGNVSPPIRNLLEGLVP